MSFLTLLLTLSGTALAAPSAERAVTVEDCVSAGRREGRAQAYAEQVRRCGPAELASVVDALVALEPVSRRVECSRSGELARGFRRGRNEGAQAGTRDADALCRSAQADLQGVLAGLRRDVSERQEAAKAIDELPLEEIPRAETPVKKGR